MNLAFKRLRVYLRLVFVVALGVGVGLVLFMNRTNEVRFWFFGLRTEAEPVNVIWLMIGTVVSTLVCWWTLSLAWGLFRDWRELQRLRAIDERDKAYRAREKELDARERRLEEKRDTRSETDTDGTEEDQDRGHPRSPNHEGELS